MQDAADAVTAQQDVYPNFAACKGAGTPNPVLKLDNRDGTQRPTTVSAMDFLEHFRDTSTDTFKYLDMLVRSVDLVADRSPLPTPQQEIANRQRKVLPIELDDVAQVRV